MALLKKTDIEIDQALGINLQKIEEGLLKSSDETYQGEQLSSDALLTSYRDYQTIISSLPKNSLLIDLGAGTGRGSLTNMLMGSPIKVISLEVVKERLEAGIEASKKWGEDPSSSFVHYDLLKKPLPKADAYFIYLPMGKLLDHLLNQLRELAYVHSFKVFAIESHGDLIDGLFDLAPWLIPSKAPLPLHSKRHRNGIFQFQSSSPDFDPKSLAPNDLTLAKMSSSHKLQLIHFLNQRDDLVVVIKDEETWLADTLGAQRSIKKDHVEFVHPPRLVHLETIKGIRNIKEEEQEYVEKRRSEQAQKKIRKIIIKPEFLIETSDGKRQAPPAE